MYHTRVRVKNFQVLAADLFSETRGALRSLYLWCISASLVCPFSLKIICLLIHFLIFIYSKYVWKTGWRILYWRTPRFFVFFFLSGHIGPPSGKNAVGLKNSTFFFFFLCGHLGPPSGENAVGLNSTFYPQNLEINCFHFITE